MSENLGMTNNTQIITLDNKKYVLRIPGVGSEKLINRKQEYVVYKTIKSYNISDEVLYFDENTGIKITKFVENSRVAKADSQSDVKRCIEAIKHLHNLNLKVEHSFDLKERINFYEKLMKKSKYKDYKKLKSTIFKLLDLVETYRKNRCLCHIDPNVDNCLLTKDRTILIDWEYAGMADPLLDIAMLGIYSNFNEEQLLDLLNLYYDGQTITKYEVFAFDVYVATAGLLWSNWCEYKNNLGQSFGGEYELSQYNFAKTFSNIALKEIDVLCIK